MIDFIELEIFKNLIASLCDQMGVVLSRSSFSPNIKERKDFSCALFDAKGDLVAQAAHIPVHLGSMPLSVRAALKAFDLNPGDMVILNDPYRGGTHLPDITLVTPVFLPRSSKPLFYAANRAHHADVGGKSPGSMPLGQSLEEEGVIIPPTLLKKAGRTNQKFLNQFLTQVRRPEERLADLKAQISANQTGEQGLLSLVKEYGLEKIREAMRALRRYEERITRLALKKIPRGKFSFDDFLDDDGIDPKPIRISVDLRVKKNRVEVDFSRSAPQVRGPVNAPYAIAVSAVAYVFRCLVLTLTGEDCLSLQPFRIVTRKGTVVDAVPPAPVAGGNVETSQRLVDVLFGALSKALPEKIPAASQGTMNNLAMGSKRFAYYETLAGGMGGGPQGPGDDAIHTHMTNTLNTPIEALESATPLRITEYRIRRGSGGRGKNKGGDGLVREYEFLEDTEVSILSDRRKLRPWGLEGGGPGKSGANFLLRNGEKIRLPGKTELRVKKGDRIRIETPGGGAWGTRGKKR